MAALSRHLSRAVRGFTGIGLLMSVSACGAKSADEPHDPGTEVQSTYPDASADDAATNQAESNPGERESSVGATSQPPEPDGDTPATTSAPTAGPAASGSSAPTGGPGAAGEPGEPTGAEPIAGSGSEPTTGGADGPDPMGNPVLIDEQLASELEFITDCDVDHLQMSKDACALGATCNGQRSFTDCYFGDDQPSHCDCRADDVEQRLEAPGTDLDSLCLAAMEYCVAGPEPPDASTPLTCDVEVKEEIDTSDLLCSAYEVCGYDIELPDGIAARIVSRRAAACMASEPGEVTACTCGQLSPGVWATQTLRLEHDIAVDDAFLCEALVTEYCGDLEIEAEGEPRCEIEPPETDDCRFRTHCVQQALLGGETVLVHSDTSSACFSLDDQLGGAGWECTCARSPNGDVIIRTPAETCEEAARTCVDAMEAQPNLSMLPDVRQPLGPG